jgi:hypothetical protein
MAITLDTSSGWVNGDEVRVLIASGLQVSPYAIQQITMCMNQLADMSVDAVNAVRNLLSEYQDAQDQMISLNTSSDGKVLIKADVLQYQVLGSGVGYGPEREMMRIQKLIWQYFGFCPLYGQSANNVSGMINLIHS